MNRASALLLAAVCLSTSPCTRHAARVRPNAMDARVARDAAVDASGPEDVPVVPASMESVVAAVRREQWAAARALAEQLPTAVKSTREVRYLRARVAIELNDHAAAQTLLHGLGREIPVFAVDVARMEASCLARTGRHADARAAYEQLAQHGGSERDHSLAALEAQAAGDAAGAARMMHDWPTHPPAGIDRARAWSAAARALEAAGEGALAARAWQRIAVEEPDAGVATEALRALERLSAPLTTDQSLARAAELIDRARYTEALAVLDPLAVHPTTALHGAQDARAQHLLGRAYFGARNRYADANVSLTAASERSDNPDREEDAFLAARALARADRDDEAIRAWDLVASAQRGRWGDEAAFRAAWLVGHHERTQEAVQRFQAFLREREGATARQRVEAWWEIGWMLYTAGRYGEAVEALQHSGEMATHHLERGRGRYWAAMARARSGDVPGALRGWQETITDRPLTYYALLSEARLRERNVTVTPPPPPPERRPPPALELPLRVRWLHALGFDDDAGTALANDEARVKARAPDGRGDEALAMLYLDMGEARRAFQLSSRHADDLDPLPTAETRWVWDAGFPRPHAGEVEAAEDAGGMPRHYLFSIMRQESGFNAHDVSNARAIGLLQMIPPTTRRAAGELGIPFREEMLYEPGYNIRVGGYYIGRLYRQYQGVLPRAIGSFNAGPGAMGRWVRQWGGDDLDVFVERIPFDETRTYVRRVMQNLARYRYLYGPHDASGPLRIDLVVGNATVEPLVDY